MRSFLWSMTGKDLAASWKGAKAPKRVPDQPGLTQRLPISPERWGFPERTASKRWKRISRSVRFSLPLILGELAPLFETGGKRDKAQASLMRGLLARPPLSEQIRLWLELFRKKDGAAKSLSYTASKKMLEGDLGLADAIEREQNAAGCPV